MKSPQTFPAITIHQPWADLIVRGVKDIENRPWPTRLRGWILVHAGKKIARDALNRDNLKLLKVSSKDDYQPNISAIIGVVQITDCVTESSSQWFLGPYGFVLEKAVRFQKPIPYSGKLGIHYVPVRLLKGTKAEAVQPGRLMDK